MQEQKQNKHYIDKRTKNEQNARQKWAYHLVRGKVGNRLMADTPKEGETANPEAPKNGTQTPAPVQGNASDAAELEKLRKERDQAQMRANQLEKEKKAREDAEAAKQAKELEEQNEFKTLFEQEKAKREALEAEAEDGKRRKELSKAKSEVLEGYSDEVKELAEEAGMALDSTDEDAKTAFKAKLDKIQQRLGVSGKVGPNNPGKPTPKAKPEGKEFVQALKKPDKFQEMVAKMPGIAAMMDNQ